MNKTVTITQKNHKYATTYGGTICQSDFCTDYIGKTKDTAGRIASAWTFDKQCRKNSLNRMKGKNYGNR